MDITYYIFGEDAVREINEGGLEQLLQNIEEYVISYGLFAFEEGKTRSVDFAEAMQGWNDYAIISKEEHDQL